MKTILITKSNYMVCVDAESMNVEDVECSREAISRIFQIKEDCLVKSGEKEIEAKSGDILITFYEKEFPNRFVIVRSKEWTENLDAYEKAMESYRKKTAADTWSNVIDEAPTCCAADTPDCCDAASLSDKLLCVNK